jgi:hypothetical protein
MDTGRFSQGREQIGRSLKIINDLLMTDEFHTKVLEKLIVTHVVGKFSSFMELEASPPYSQNPAICPYSEPI